MKILPAHYAAMRDAIAGKADYIPAYAAYIAGDARVKNAAMRLRWDMLHATLGSHWVCRELYPYVDDTHIDTALKAVMRELGF